MTQLADIAAEQPPTKPDGVNAAKIPEKLWVMDTTALPGKGPRNHDMIVAETRGQKIIKSFKFEPGAPTELPFPIAIKFLKIPAFRRTDAEGNLLAYHRQPKQPHELGAGERFELKDNQTVAEYAELSNMSLLQRALELPGGELVDKTNRDGLIDFIVNTTVAQRKANSVKEPRAATPELEFADIGPVEDE